MSGENRDHYHQLMFHDELSSFFWQKTSGAAATAAIDTTLLGFDPQGISPPLASFSDHSHGSVMDHGSLARAFDFSCSPPRAASAAVPHEVTADASEGGNRLTRTGGSGCVPQETINTSAGSSSSSGIGCEEVDARLSKKEQAKLVAWEESEKKKQVQKELSEGRTCTDKSTKLDESRNKPRKKGEKRQREHRFAFMTRSEVDNLEDGYRWRKYGQKAVKNSPYPRSYYRCTAQKCSVKKRVERSYQDPNVVITTYEGQHTHQSPAAIRASAHLLAPPAAPPFLTSNFHQNLFMQQVTSPLPNDGINSTNPNMFLQPISVPTPAFHEQHQIQFSDYYPLQDSMVTPFFNNGSRT